VRLELGIGQRDDAEFERHTLTQIATEESPVTDKSNFTPDEWKVLLESVMMADGSRTERALGNAQRKLRCR
jgi:hypothetical protein